MAGSSPPGQSRPPVRVRYYPRRVARPRVTAPLSPGQALHLADDPGRAALARDTAQEQVFVAVERPDAPAPDAPVVREAVAVDGRWRRLWRRLTGAN